MACSCLKFSCFLFQAPRSLDCCPLSENVETERQRDTALLFSRHYYIPSICSFLSRVQGIYGVCPNN